MKRQTYLILGTCAIFGTLLLIGLYTFSEKIVHEPNNFFRKYIPDIAKHSAKFDVGYNSYYIAGSTKNNLYFGNYSNPFHLLVTNYALTDTQHVRLKVEKFKSWALTKYIKVYIDSPNFYLMDGVMPGVFKGKLGEWDADRCLIDSVYFSQSIPINSNSFGIRTKSSKTKEYTLGKMFEDSPSVSLEPSLLQKQIDGIFCTDGALNYSKELNRLVYTYFYRNEYIVYDTNLNLDFRGQTIDTFSTAQVKVASINSENKTVLATRPKFINKGSSVFSNYLFIYSALLAKNDSKDALENASIVDVYDLRNNTYKLSFKVWKKMREFKVIDSGILVFLYERHIVVYKLNSEFFN